MAGVWAQMVLTLGVMYTKQSLNFLGAFSGGKNPSVVDQHGTEAKR